MGRRNSFPEAKSADEGARIFVAQEIGGLVQFEEGVVEVVAGQLMTSLFKDLLEAIACILQAALQGSGTHVEFTGDVLHFGAVAGKVSLNRGADSLGKGLLVFALFQFLVELRCEHSQELGVAGHEGQSSIRCTKDDRVSGRSEDDGATKVAPENFFVRRPACEFEAQRCQAGSCSVTCDAEHPGEAEVGEDLGLGVVSEEPTELNTPLGVVGFVNNLFRAGELFIASHLTHGFAEARRRERSQGDGIEVFRSDLGAQLQPYRRVRAGLTYASPQSKELFRGYDY